MMLQEIYPKVYRPEYIHKKAQRDSLLLHYDNNNILLKKSSEKSGFSLPHFYDIERENPDIYEKSIYLFSIDDEEFFIIRDKLCREPEKGFMRQAFSIFRSFSPKYQGFAIATGFHIYSWMNTKRFCGACGNLTIHSTKERAVVCPRCGHREYPKIAPAAIVAIIDGERILLTKRAGGDYKWHALVSGFTEVGETLADTIRREVKEEVGLNVKNIRYYKSQPWGISESIMLAFIAELDGDDRIRLQESELSEAKWFYRKDIPLPPDYISVGQELIQAFREGKF